MLKVMVVDDEPIVRLALKSLVNWENHGFDLCCEAANGKQALEIYKNNPDIKIIITDINMPVMDGLELISAIKEKEDGCGIVVLSAYDDYNLVRKSFKLGVMDYILKNDMDPDNILKLLEGIASKIKLEDGTGRDKSEQGIEINLLKEKFLRELIELGEVEDPEGNAIRLKLQFGKNNILACCLLIDDFLTVTERYQSHGLKTLTTSVNNAIRQILNEINTGEVLCISPQEYLIVFSFENLNTIQAREKAVEILGKIKYSLRNYINVNISIGVSSIRSGFSNIALLYREAQANVKLRFFLGKGRVIFPENAVSLINKDINTIIGKEPLFTLALKEINKEMALEELGKLLELIKNSNCSNFDKSYACYMEIIYMLINFLKERNEDITGVLGDNLNFYNTITRFETQEEINDWIKNLVVMIIDYIVEKKDIKVNRAIIRVQEFVRENYNKDINLKAASEFVGLSESHLSYIFTKMTGETFTDYLTRIRIEKAKELLEKTNLKVYEVSVSVGYANAEHFSRVFKRITGSSPNSYKSI